MGKGLSKAARRAQKREAADAAYRKALGINEGQSLPSKIGQAESGGAGRGGRGSAQRGKGRNS